MHTAQPVMSDNNNNNTAEDIYVPRIPLALNVLSKTSINTRASIGDHSGRVNTWDSRDLQVIGLFAILLDVDTLPQKDPRENRQYH